MSDKRNLSVTLNQSEWATLLAAAEVIADKITALRPSGADELHAVIKEAKTQVHAEVFRVVAEEVAQQWDSPNESSTP